MAFLDRFRSHKPQTKPRGESGRGHVNGYLALEELNTELRGRRGFEIYDRMYRTDPDVRRNVSMVCNPIVGATWSMDPYGGDEAEERDKKAADLAWWALTEAMTGGLIGHLVEALPVLIRSGFAPFEETWMSAEWEGKKVLVPRSLGLRLPRTIHRFPQNDLGELQAIEQWTPTGKTATIEVENLVYYRLGAEGDNWEGTSLLRPAYKPWYLKDKIERLDAIAIEREATGVPIAYPPGNATATQLEEMEETLANVRTNEQGFIVAPGPKAEHLRDNSGDGWTIEILSNKSTEQRSAQPSLEYHRDAIAAAFVAEFMRLGQGGVGARATADVQQDPFLAGVEAIAGTIETALQGLVNKIVALNCDVDEAPKLTMSLVDSTSLEQLSTYVGHLVEKGVLQPDTDLEDYLRERADLPPANAEEREEHQAAAKAARERLAAGGGGEDPPKPGAPPTPAPEPEPDPKKTDAEPEPRKWSRDLRWWEQHLQLEVIDTAISGARERFELAGGDPARAVARQFADAALKGTAVQPKHGDELEQAIYSELLSLHETGRRTVAAELASQKGSALDVGIQALADGSERDLKRRAKIAATSIAGRIWQAVSRAALGRPGEKAIAQSAGEAEAGAALRAEAQLHASSALNSGRAAAADEMDHLVAGSRYTSILDPNRCRPCASADDDVLRPLDDPVRLANLPPNPNCQGGGRCRCIEFFEYKDEDESEGPPPAPEPPRDPIVTSPSVHEHFDIKGGSAAQRALVDDQLRAIQSVHRMPAEIPRTQLRIGALKEGTHGLFAGEIVNGRVAGRITVNADSLRRNPPITSVVHEIGHLLDASGFGTRLPVSAVLSDNWFSTTGGMGEWRDAVVKSNAHRQLLSRTAGNPYPTDTLELLARSYEQWIATHSGNVALWAKIRKRNEEEPDMYWSDEDFKPIAKAFDRFFATRGLRG